MLFGAVSSKGGQVGYGPWNSEVAEDNPFKLRISNFKLIGYTYMHANIQLSEKQ